MTACSSIQPISFFGVFTFRKRRPRSSTCKVFPVGDFAGAVGDRGHAVAKEHLLRGNVDHLRMQPVKAVASAGGKGQQGYSAQDNSS